MRRVELRYRAAAYYEDELLVEVRVARVRAASASFEYALRRPADGTCLLTGAVELACVKLGPRPPRPRMLPAPLAEALEAVVEPA